MDDMVTIEVEALRLSIKEAMWNAFRFELSRETLEQIIEDLRWNGSYRISNM